MYNNMGIGVGTSAAVGGALAVTGIPLVWLVLAGFALLATGCAIMRIVPKRSRKIIA